VILVLILVHLLPPPPAQEKGEAMARIEALLQEGAHEEALKALRIYRRKHAETDEEKEEVDALLRAAEGGMDLDAITEEYRKRKRPRRAVTRLDDLVREYRDLPGLISRAEKLRESLRSLYVLQVEDFEKETSESVEDPDLVRHGKRSTRWKPRDREAALDTLLPEPQDWTEHAFFCAWIHSPDRTYPSTQLRISAIEGPLPYAWFEAYLVVDWKGWRNVRIPLRGRQGRFRPHGKPGWTGIGRIMVFQEQGPLTELIIDDVRVEKATE
jgi:hypothetical protein